MREKHYSLVWYMLTQDIPSLSSQSEHTKIDIHRFGIYQFSIIYTILLKDSSYLSGPRGPVTLYTFPSVRALKEVAAINAEFYFSPPLQQLQLSRNDFVACSQCYTVQCFQKIVSQRHCERLLCHISLARFLQ